MRLCRKLVSASGLNSRHNQGKITKICAKREQSTRNLFPDALQKRAKVFPMPQVLGFELEWAVAEIGVTVVFIGVDNPIVCEVEVLIYLLLATVIFLERIGIPALT